MWSRGGLGSLEGTSDKWFLPSGVHVRNCTLARVSVCVRVCACYCAPGDSTGHFYCASLCLFPLLRQITVTGMKASDQVSRQTIPGTKHTCVDSALQYRCVIVLPPFSLSLSVVIRHGYCVKLQ